MRCSLPLAPFPFAARRGLTPPPTLPSSPPGLGDLVGKVARDKLCGLQLTWVRVRVRARVRVSVRVIGDR